MPNVPMKTPTAISMPISEECGSKTNARMPVATPEAALSSQNVLGSMSRPARMRRRRSVTFSLAFCRVSMSFSVSATCFLRLAAISAADRVEIFLVRLSVTSSTRLSRSRSPEMYGYMTT